jgi:hypothetical protein
MHCQGIDCQTLDLTQESFPETLNLEATENPTELDEETLLVHFQAHFVGHMEMYADSLAVAEYLNAHQGWFCRCAQPMKVEPIDNNGYILTVGQFRSFGYEVEPKIAAILHPPQDGKYLMNSVPIPEYNAPGYEVDYRASMELIEVPTEQADKGIFCAYKKKGIAEIPLLITKVNWQMHMDVAVQFPKFIYKLPFSLIKSTGDRLLAQIIRQVSPRLTYKVQQDFHLGCNLPLPPKSASTLQRISQESVEEDNN